VISANIDIDATGKIIITEYRVCAAVPAALAGYTVVPDFRLPAPPPSAITRLVSTAHAFRLRKLRELTIFATAEARLRRSGLPTPGDGIEAEARKIAGVLEKYS
jgi:hypothetical protein